MGRGKNCQLHATLLLLSCHAAAAVPGYELQQTLSCSSCFSLSKPHRSRPFTPSISKERTEAISRYTAGEGWRPGGSLPVWTCRNKPGAKPESLTSAARDPKAIEKRVQSPRLAFATICCWTSSGRARTNVMATKEWRNQLSSLLVHALCQTGIQQGPMAAGCYGLSTEYDKHGDQRISKSLEERPTRPEESKLTS